MTDPDRRNAGVAIAALLASTMTLVCCVLPAALVSIGAGAAVAGLVSAVPQLVWLSERKPLVFGGAAALLAIAGFVIWRTKSLPCPADPELARACMRLRRLSHRLYAASTGVFLLGAGFVFWPW